jgi:PleD family two-component response regulator
MQTEFAIIAENDRAWRHTVKDGLRILCVDDDELNTKALRRILGSLGYQVQTAGSWTP